MTRIALVTTLLLLAVGCGNSNSSSNTCDNLANALNALPGKYAACGTVPSVSFDKNACTTAFNNSACSDADRQKINDFANCLQALPTCTVATQSSWATSYENCTTPLQSISSNC